MLSAITPVGSDSPPGPIGTYDSGRNSEQKLPVEKTLLSGKLSSQQVDALVKELNDTIRIINTRLSFSVDKVTKKTVVKVMDADTQEVIRQIPPEEMLRIAARITELLGVLFDEKG